MHCLAECKGFISYGDYEYSEKESHVLDLKYNDPLLELNKKIARKYFL